MFRLRRTLLTATIAVAAVAALGATTACSTSDNSSTSGPAAAGFPVTIEHVHGATEIPTKPQRVVTLGWMAEDVVAALGTAPVGVPKSWAGDDQGYAPWFRDQVQNVLRQDLPAVLKEGEEPDYEQILQLDPDLILAPHSGVTENQYKRLSAIAPTVAYPERAWRSGTWQDLTGVVATALGEKARGDELITQTQNQITAASDAHPEMKGKSFLYGVALSPGSTELGVYAAGDSRVAFIREFGLVDSPDLAQALGEIGSDEVYGGTSLENLGDIASDLFIGWSSSTQETQDTLKNPKFSRWTPIVDGNYLFLESRQMGMATNAPSPLSIPWAIDHGFVRELASAVSGGRVVVPAP